MNYARVLKNWVTGLWNIAQLKMAYQKGIITKEQYRYIKSLPHGGSEAE